jgi:hypothetical protein
MIDAQIFSSLSAEDEPSDIYTSEKICNTELYAQIYIFV